MHQEVHEGGLKKKTMIKMLKTRCWELARDVALAAMNRLDPAEHTPTAEPAPRASEPRREPKLDRVDRRHKTYFDVYESWVDKVPLSKRDEISGDLSGVVRLFTDPRRGSHDEEYWYHANRSNFDGFGCFRDCDFRLSGLKVLVQASTPELAERVRLDTEVDFTVGHMSCFSTTLALAEQGCVRPPESGPTITRLQNFDVTLRFAPAVAQMLRELRTKVGPGAGWISIRAEIEGVESRNYYELM